MRSWQGSAEYLAMVRITDWMVRKFVARPSDVTDQEVRSGYVRLECWTSIVGNIFLGSVKLVLGLITRSIALTADAAHTYGDMISSVVLLVSMRVAAAPPDKKHPHGHGRAEALGTLALAAMLIITAVEFAHPAFDRLVGLDRSVPAGMKQFGWLLIPVLILFWGFKEWMARFSGDLGKRISSEALEGDAQHHRSDALATLLVVCSFVGASFDMLWLDGLFGLGVAGFIGWAGVSLAWAMISRLMGEAPSEDIISRIMTAAAAVRGVRGVHSIEMHDYGNHKVVSLHVEVDGRMHTDESHQVATLVEQSVLRRLGYSAVVHMEVKKQPVSDARAEAVEAILRETVERERDVLGFHAIQVTSSDRQLAVDFHLTVRPGLTVEECHRIEHELAARVGQRMGTAKVNIHCEPAKRQGRGHGGLTPCFAQIASQGRPSRRDAKE